MKARRVRERPRREPVWVHRVVVLAAHTDQIREHGGLAGIRDAYGIDAALARPINRHAYEPGSDIASLAAAYLFAFARGQHFNDGNKRVSLAVALIFLDLNGYEMAADVGDEDVAGVVLEVASGNLSEAACANWIRDRLVPRRGYE